MIKKELPNLKEGEPLNIIAHSHGGNVVKYASQELSQGELDNVVFLATPHRKDAQFNDEAMKKGGKVVNVYDRSDLIIQRYLGNMELDGIANQTMPGAINIRINTTPLYQQYDAHTTIQTRDKWNQFVAPIFRDGK